MLLFSTANWHAPNDRSVVTDCNKLHDAGSSSEAVSCSTVSTQTVIGGGDAITPDA
jgi:hypothetical protein